MSTGSNFFGASLDSIYSTDDYPKKIFQGKEPLSKNIKDSIPKPVNIQKVTSFFIDHLNENKIANICMDFSIPSYCRKDFHTLCTALACFFKEIVINDTNSISKTVAKIYEELILNPSLISNKKIETSEAQYLLEIKKCPICKKPLTKIIDNTRYRNYEIIQIYPSDLTPDQCEKFNKIEDRSKMNLNDEKNNIALCITCAHLYKMSHSEDTYKKLLEEKKGALKEAQIQEKLDSRDMESNISKVIDALIDIRNPNKLTKLSLNALKISEKLNDVPTIVYNSIEDKVLRYYNFIDNYLQQKEFIFEDGATIIGSEIKLMSNDLVNLGLSKTKILETLKIEINNRIHGDSETLEACGIIVAYFVQHCEVLTI